MRSPADIAVYDEQGKIRALVDVKAVPQTTAEWATQIRQAALEEGDFVPPYFLAIARDCSYIWTSPAVPDAPPDQVVSTDELFQKYLKDIDCNAQSIAPSSLELMVGIWLTDLAQQTQSATRATVIAQSGLSSAVANGRVEFLTAA
jgi:hypothetical protein